ncbi:MAG: formate dehydrogenase accessory sulfurtransferase FdhD [bacterium]
MKRDRVVREEPLNILVNGKPYAVLMRTPGDEENLVLGFLYSEGVVNHLEEIDFVRYCSKGKGKNTVVVELKGRNRHSREGGKPCVVPVPDFSRINSGGAQSVPLSGTGAFFLKNLINLDKKIAKKQKVFKLTGGTHAAGLFDKNGRLILLKEDISRHNALDKVIGYVFSKRINCQDKVIFLSGRTSYEMILKVIRLGAPVVASISGTTSLAIDLSKKFNLTLIGFLRGETMTVYSHPGRIK